jgi:hypothetical protein
MPDMRIGARDCHDGSTDCRSQSCSAPARFAEAEKFDENGDDHLEAICAPQYQSAKLAPTHNANYELDLVGPNTPV